MAADELAKNVFVSWAGNPTRLVAEALRDELGWAMQNANLWVSSADLQPGQIWFGELRKQLALKIGIVLLTPGTEDNRWVNFEAGAVFGGIEKDGIVMVVLFGYPKGATLDSRHPLSSLQQVHADREGFRRIFGALAKAVKDPRTDSQLDKGFVQLWNAIKDAIEVANKESLNPKDSAPEEFDTIDALKEIRQALRDIKADQSARAQVDETTSLPRLATTFSTQPTIYRTESGAYRFGPPRTVFIDPAPSGQFRTLAEEFSTLAASTPGGLPEVLRRAGFNEVIVPPEPPANAEDRAENKEKKPPDKK